MENLETPYYPYFHDPTSLSLEVLDEVLTKASKIIYESYVIKTKMPPFIGKIALESILMIAKQENRINQEPSNPPVLSIDQTVDKSKIDSWAFQSVTQIQQKPKVQTEDPKQEERQMKKLKQLFKPPKEDIPVIKHEDPQIDDPFKLSSSEESEDNWDEGQIQLDKVLQRLRFERQDRESIKEKEIIQDIPQVVSQKAQPTKEKQQKRREFTYDFDGQPIYVQRFDENWLPQQLAIIKYEENDPIVKQRPYQNLNIQIQNTVELKDNFVMNQLIAKHEQALSQPNQNQKVYKQEIDQNFDLQMGVKMIKDDGVVLKGPEIAFSNRPRKKDYNDMIKQDISETSHGYSVSGMPRQLPKNPSQQISQEASEIEEDSDQESKFIKVDQEMDNFVIQEQKPKQPSNTKNIKILKDLEYGKMMYSLNNRGQITNRLQSAKPNIQMARSKPLTNRIHSYRPEILVPDQKTFRNAKNTQKLENFNNQNILQNDQWGQVMQEKKLQLPNLQKSRIKSAYPLNNTRSKKNL